MIFFQKPMYSFCTLLLCISKFNYTNNFTSFKHKLMTSPSGNKKALTRCAEFKKNCLFCFLSFYTIHKLNFALNRLNCFAVHPLHAGLFYAPFQGVGIFNRQFQFSMAGKVTVGLAMGYRHCVIGFSTYGLSHHRERRASAIRSSVWYGVFTV